MNLYIYDDFLNKSRYNRAINRIEIRLTDLGLNGKIIRLGTIKNIKSLIQQEVRNGAKNIIAVGNNSTANKVASALVDDKLSDLFSKDILFSLIPIGENQSIANALGIKNEAEACNIILARRIEKIDIGQAGRYYFLNKAEIKKSLINVDFSEQYNLEIPKKSSLSIYNLNDNPKLKANNKLKPNDGALDMFITGKSGDYSYFSVEKIKISGPGQLILDNSIKINLPINVGVIRNKLKIIVGKDRLF